MLTGICLVVLGLPILIALKGWLTSMHFQWKSRKLGYELPFAADEGFLGLKGMKRLVKAQQESRLLFFLEELRELEQRPLTTYASTASGIRINTLDPENLKAVLSSQFKHYDIGNRHDLTEELLGDGIFTVSGDMWHKSRAVLRPQFTRDQVSRQVKEMEPHVTRLIDKFKQLKKTGSLFDVQHLFQSLTLEISFQFLFSEDIDYINGSQHDTAFQTKFDAAAEFITFKSLFQSFHKLIFSLENRRNVRFVHEYIDKLVDRALTRKRNQHESDVKDAKNDTFINALINETSDIKTLRDQCLNILLAGRDTTSSLLASSLWFLARDPEMYRELRRVVVEEFGTDTDKINFDSLRSCEPLKNFINEVLRINQPVPSNLRQAKTDTFLPKGGVNGGPIFVPKGTTIYIGVWLLHRSKSIWGDDAHEFKPSRWNQPDYPSNRWSFLPFSGGPRICIGQQLALVEASYTLVRILQNFSDIETSPEEKDMPYEQQCGLIVTCKRGINVTFVEAE